VVLQVILIDRYFEHFANGNRDEFNNTSIKIGRNFIVEGKPMPPFPEYVRKALAKLELDSDSVFITIQKTCYIKKKKKIID
jgi:hypothetical protein